MLITAAQVLGVSFQALAAEPVGVSVADPKGGVAFAILTIAHTAVSMRNQDEVSLHFIALALVADCR
jgi:hypothetical protein